VSRRTGKKGNRILSFNELDVAEAYRKLAHLLEQSGNGSRIAMLAYFWGRLSTYVLEPGDRSAFRLFVDLVREPNLQKARTLAEQNRQISLAMPENAELIAVGYWSVRSFSFAYLAESNGDLAKYAADNYLDGAESFSEKSGGAIAVELQNLTEIANVLLEIGQKQALDRVENIRQWALSQPLCTKLGPPLEF
jgi:hypothetical protein